MKLAEIICFDAIVPELQAKDRDGAIRELIQALARAGRLGSAEPQKVAQAVIKRENEASTGIGKGVAVPHAKHPDIPGVIAAVGGKSQGLDFSSLDKKPVYSILLLLSPTKSNERHLQAMECIFSNLQKDDFRKFLRQSTTAEQIREVVIDADESPAR